MTEQLDLDLEFFEEVEENGDEDNANDRNEIIQSPTETSDPSKVAEFKYKSLHINVVSSNQISTTNGNSYTVKNKPINLEKSKCTIYKLTPKPKVALLMMAE